MNAIVGAAGLWRFAYLRLAISPSISLFQRLESIVSAHRTMNILPHSMRLEVEDIDKKFFH
jgi:hypothetical protein